MKINSTFVPIAVLCVASLAGCGGAGGGSVPETGAGVQQLAKVNFAIAIPKTQSGQRDPRYISASTSSVGVIVTPTGGTALASQTVSCTTSACQGAINAPIGSDSFVVTLLDKSGATLSQGSTTATINAGVANTVSVTFNGVINAINLSFAATATLGSAGSLTINVVAKDADGNNIVGPGNYSTPITLSDSDSARTSLSTTSITAPSTASITLNYDGTGPVTANINASAGPIKASQLSFSGTAAVGSGSVVGAALLTQKSSTVADGIIGAGKTAAIAVAISEAVDQAPTRAFTPVLLSAGTGPTALTSLRSPAASSVEASAGHARSPVEIRPPNDAYVHAILQRIPQASSTASVTRHIRSSTIPSTLTVGTTTANIWTAIFAIGATSSSYVQVPSTLVAQTVHGNIWADNSLMTGVNASTAFSPGSLNSTAAQIGNAWESDYTSDTAHFASADYSASSPGLQVTYATCDSSGALTGGGGQQYINPPSDNRINVVILNSKNLGDGVGGYFSSVNYLPQAVLNCENTPGAPVDKSNEAPMFYMGWFDSSGAQYELGEDVVRGMAHEFQHEINFVNHSILPAGASSASFNGNEDTFINEGLSMLAQDLALPALYPATSHDVDDALQHAAQFMVTPQSYSLTGFIGIDPSSWGGNGSTARYNCGGGCYGSAFLFERYMRDRFGGDAYTQGMETSGKVGFANLSANAGGESASSLIGDFGTALAASAAGLSGTGAFNLGSLAVGGTYNDQSGTPFSMPRLGFAATIATASTQTFSAPLGGFGFVSFSAIPSGGEPVSLQDTVGTFGIVGGLAQK